MRRFATVFTIAAVSLISSRASAFVDPRSGTYTATFTDLAYLGGLAPHVQRIYSSRTNFKGAFGWGWNSEPEVTISPTADGGWTVHEYGGGVIDRFYRREGREAEIAADAAKLIELGKNTGIFPNAKEEQAYRAKLLEDTGLRIAEVEKAVAHGKMPRRSPPEKGEFFSEKYSGEKLRKDGKGFVRVFASGGTEKFDEKGRRVRVTDPGGNWIQYEFTKEGHIAKVDDNFNRRIFFSYDSNGSVSELEGESGRKARYRYNDRGELIWAQNTKGEVFTYKYDDQGRHNLIEVVYPDKSVERISYLPLAKGENVKSVAEKDGSVSEYSYSTDSADPLHLTVTQSTKSAKGDKTSKFDREYFEKRAADGHVWLYRMVRSQDGKKSETFFNECCGKPVSIKRGNVEMTFDYDLQGRNTRRTLPDLVTEFAYDRKSGKIVKLTQTSRRNPKSVFWAEYQYDDKGRMTMARNSKHQGAKLVYNTQGFAISMLDQKKRRLDLKYNEFGLPVEIAQAGLGKLEISYGNTGEIKSVQSPNGPKAASEIQAFYRNLTALTNPANPEPVSGM